MSEAPAASLSPCHVYEENKNHCLFLENKEVAVCVCWLEQSTGYGGTWLSHGQYMEKELQEAWYEASSEPCKQTSGLSKSFMS